MDQWHLPEEIAQGTKDTLKNMAMAPTETKLSMLPKLVHAHWAYQWRNERRNERMNDLTKCATISGIHVQTDPTWVKKPCKDLECKKDKIGSSHLCINGHFKQSHRRKCTEAVTSSSLCSMYEWNPWASELQTLSTLCPVPTIHACTRLLVRYGLGCYWPRDGSGGQNRRGEGVKEVVNSTLCHLAGRPCLGEWCRCDTRSTVTTPSGILTMLLSSCLWIPTSDFTLYTRGLKLLFIPDHMSTMLFLIGLPYLVNMRDHKLMLSGEKKHVSSCFWPSPAQS